MLAETPASFGDLNKLCPGCGSIQLTRFLQVLEEQRPSLTYGVNWPWFMSEASKLAVQIGFGANRYQLGGTMNFICRLVHWFNAFSRFANCIKILEIVIPLVERLEPENFEEQHLLLDMAGYAILSNRFAIAQALLRKAGYQDFESYLSLDGELQSVARALHGGEDKVPMHIFVRAVSQCKIIQWFQSHPQSARQIFSHDHIWGYSRPCHGIVINDLHVCTLGAHVKHAFHVDDHSLYLMVHDSGELKASLPLDPWLALWHFLYRYGDWLERIFLDGVLLNPSALPSLTLQHFTGMDTGSKLYGTYRTGHS